MEGGKYRFPLGADTVTLGSIDLSAAQPTEWHADRHCHADFELHVILEGRCRVDVEMDSLELGAGDAILIAPGYYHRPRSAPEPFLRLSLSLQLRTLRLGLPYRILHPDSWTLSLCRQFLREQNLHQPFRGEMLNALLMTVTLQFLRLLPAMESEPAAGADPAEVRTGQIDDYFETRLAGQPSEEELAQQLHLSRRQLCRVLQKHYGMSFRQKLLCARMDRAGWLLLRSEHSVGEIAQMTGYASESAFFKAFRTCYGTTPLKFRIGGKEQCGK